MSSWSWLPFRPSMVASLFRQHALPDQVNALLRRVSIAPQDARPDWLLPLYCMAVADAIRKVPGWALGYEVATLVANELMTGACDSATGLLYSRAFEKVLLQVRHLANPGSAQPQSIVVPEDFTARAVLWVVGPSSVCNWLTLQRKEVLQ